MRLGSLFCVEMKNWQTSIISRSFGNDEKKRRKIHFISGVI